MSAQLVVALDVPDAARAEALIDELYELDLVYKVGLEPLYGYGERLFAYAQARDVRIFIDAKIHDIPRTAAAAVTQLVRHATHIVNVHALGGASMMSACVQAARARAAELAMTPPHVFAVTVLTSMSARDLEAVGLQGDAESNAMRLARLARDAGCDGIVCSAHESASIKSSLGEDFLTLTPGIRPAGAAAHDQQRVATPRDAVLAGADYLVVGRPVTAARDALSAAQTILSEMRSAHQHVSS